MKDSSADGSVSGMFGRNLH